MSSFHLRRLFQLLLFPDERRGHPICTGCLFFYFFAEGFLPVETRQEIAPELGYLGVETANPGDRLMSLKDPHSPHLLPFIIYF